jgi:hypothetical protein
MACDDMVLAQTASPRAYASFLISFAEKLQNARGLALAQALVSRMRQMSLRVAQILDSKTARTTPRFGSRFWAWARACLRSSLVLLLTHRGSWRSRLNRARVKRSSFMRKQATNAEAQPVPAEAA